MEAGGYKICRLNFKKKGMGKYYPGDLITRHSRSPVSEI
jgi:hypothetical protein